MSLLRHYQCGYVTHDLDRALELMRPVCGAVEFAQLDLELPVRTPRGEGLCNLRVALGWMGSMQIELIQPVSGLLDLYQTALPSDPSDAGPRFHHIAFRYDDSLEMQKEVERIGLPVVFESDSAGFACSFVDVRQRFGHYFELVCASSDIWEAMGWPQAA